jgi:hypothetical protein
MGSGCLSQTGEILDKFQKGTLTADEHQTFFDCTHQALSTFLNYAVGKNPGYFEPSELSGFLSKYFLNNREIPPTLVTEWMALKVAFLGGTADQLTRDDLSHAIEFWESLRVATGKVRTVMPFTADSFLSKGVNGVEFESSIAAFLNATSDFGKAQRVDQGSYSLDRLSVLIQGLQTFLYSNGVPADHWTNTFLRIAKILPAAKDVLISPPSSEILGSDWTKIYKLVPRYYAFYLRASFYLKAPSFDFANSLDGFYTDFADTFDFLVKAHPNQQITSQEIANLIQALDSAKMLGVQASTATNLAAALFGRTFGGAGISADYNVTKSSISRLDENMRYFLEGAHAIEALYPNADSLSASDIANASAAKLVEATKLQNALSREAVDDILQIPSAIHTVFPGTSDVVVIPAHGLPDQFSRSHILKVHAMHAFNRLLLESYGTSNATELTPGQIETFTGDIFPLLIDLNYVHKTTQAKVPKIITETTLFLYSSTGQTNISMSEGIEMETLLLSVFSNASTVHQDIATACQVAIQPGVPPEVPAACYREQFAARMAETWSFLPGLAAFSQSLSASDRLKLFDTMSVLHAKPAPGSDDLYIDSDTEAFLLMPYYVELLFSRYDNTGGGIIGNKEAAVAYPVFKPFLAGMANTLGYSSEKDYSAIYNFLLAYKEMPTQDKFDYIKQRYLLGDKAFQDDRGAVMQIFATILAL